MKGSSKVMMGATLSMVMILVIVLGLVLVLLAELYCSLLLRRRKLESAKPSENPPIPRPEQAQDQSTPSPLSSFYCHGVLDAPRSFLFPKLPSKRENPNDDIEKQKHGKLHEFLRVRSPVLHMGLPSSSYQSPCISVPKPLQSNQEPELQVEVERKSSDDEACHGGSKRENFMYISNPIYDNSSARLTRVETDTPFGTPDSSPSRLGGDGSSGEEERENPDPSSPSSLPVTPVKELPTKACSSVGLKGAKSLGNSIISDSTTSHIGKSSSSSSSPHTSTSW